MQIIDTHTHLYLPEFDTDRTSVLERATDAGITHLLLPAIDTATHAQLLALEAVSPHCRAMMGLHPCSVTEHYKAELAAVEGYLKSRRFVAIGEIGLDFYWDTTFKQEQYNAFETQAWWALQYDLPIAIHSRNALDECIAVVRNFPGLRGVFHCFSGTAAQAHAIMNLGFYLGIGGVATYKKAGVDTMLREVGFDAVVLETDAPYLTPVPYRGKRNEPTYLSFVINHLAAATDQTPEKIAQVTTQNAIKVFGLT